ncbi:MAG TPA: DNA-formamidopyrimidine glycosylase family protein [Actinomycetota bacterium]|nr:DNA-formamidopyrimidine glycosylase family protein [Actinomycetota bacterium]
MPELPEMQALAERLDVLLRGAVLESVTPLQFSALKTFDPAPEEVCGRPVLSVSRRGKYVIVDLDGLRLVFHLSQGGRVDIEDPPKSSRPKFGVMRLSFRDRPSVLVKEFGTERKAGWWVLRPPDEGPLAKLGPEPGSAQFRELITSGSDGRRIHTMLRDQRTVAGIGRGYSDDILHRARISPYATLASLQPDKREDLLRALDEVLAQGLEAERQRTGGLPTKIGDHFTVHGRYGTPCPACDGDLRRVSYESHEVTYCPTCQTGGKVLADRRMSRLVR